MSGSNVAVVAGAAVGLARLLRARSRTTAVVGLVAIAAFAVLARPDPSVLRASVMGALAVVAVAAGRPRLAWPGLGAAVLLLVLVDPLLARSVGFALSVVATAGLLALGPPLRRRLARRLPGLAADALAVSLAAQAAVTPVLLLSGLPSGVAAVPANVLAAPAVPLATLVGVAAVLVAVVWPSGGAAVAHLAAPPTWWLVRVARAGAAVDGRLPDVLGPLAAVAAALVVVGVLARGSSRTGGRRRPVRGRLLVAVAVVVGVPGLVVLVRPDAWPPRGWAVVACDVGQGDALVLAAGRGAAVLVDAGPSAALVDDCLRDLGVGHVPLVVLSHLHADHVDGLAAALRGRGPSLVLVGPQPDGTSLAPLRALAAGLHADVERTQQGAVWRVGTATVQVLAPTARDVLAVDGLNDASLLLRAEVEGLSILLPGDLEEDGQRRALRLGEALRSDVLKVPHHGSADGDPRLAPAVAPRVALVSVGEGNSYGHPRPEVLRALEAAGAAVGRTDRSGDLAVVVTPDGPVLVARGGERRAGQRR